MSKRQSKAKRAVTVQQKAFKQGAKVRREVRKAAKAAKYGALSALATVSVGIAAAKSFAQGLWQA